MAVPDWSMPDTREIYTSLRVLLIDDSADEAELILREMRHGGLEPTWVRVDSVPALAAALARQKWDLIICDWVMPRLGAQAALQVVQDRGVDAPVIIVSGQVGEEVAVTALKGGANDYVSKNKLTRLVPAVRRELREAEERRARKRVEEELRASEVKYQDLYENAPDMFASVEPVQGLIIECNTTLATATGYAKEEIIGRPIFTMYHPDCLEEVRRAFRSFVETVEVRGA